MSPRFCASLLVAGFCLPLAARAQSRFELRAEPDVIPANGLSTTSIFVQVPSGSAAITPNSVVRFATTAGTIEGQAVLSGGVARVLLRSASTPGTATVTAFVNGAREDITVEFAEDTGLRERFLEVAAPYTAYGKDTGIITSAGKTSLDFGDLHIESDVRLDVDLNMERIWAQGNAGSVVIANGSGKNRVELRGDRLFYDLRKRQGVMRRSQANATGGARQEFVGSKFAAPPAPLPSDAAPVPKSDAPALLVPPQASAAAPDRVTDTRQPTAGTRELVTDTRQPVAGTRESVAGTRQPMTDAPDSSAAVPGSPAAAPESLVQSGETRSNPLVAQPKPDADGPGLPTELPSYKPLPDGDFQPRIVELPPPNFNTSAGYWVASRRLRVFPRDKVQFERAAIFFNGGKAFSLPLYVLPLDGSFNPQTDLFSFNSRGGASVRFPYYYQASKGGTGTLFLNNAMGGGFSRAQSGPSIEVQQQYWLSSRSHGNFGVDQIGRGDFNVNFAHQQQLDPRTTANLFVNAPRHRDLYARATVARDLSAMQIGFEGFYDRPENTAGNLRGQFYARMRPKTLGKSGWTYSLSANALAVQRVAFQLSGGVAGTGGLDPNGGGISIGGNPAGGTAAVTGYRALLGQTLNASLSSPSYSPWRGSTFSANLLATAYNYSDHRRGLAPGVNLAFGQSLGKRANLGLSYTYDRASLGLYGATATSFTHYFTANANARLGDKIVASGFASRSLSDKSLYGNAGLDYYFAPKWRAGAFVDYASFSLARSRTVTTGWSLGRAIGNRELSLNHDSLRGKTYVLFSGGGGY